MNNINRKVMYDVYDQVRGQIVDHVWYQVRENVRDHVISQVLDILYLEAYWEASNEI